jgi:hypothetical protein
MFKHHMLPRDRSMCELPCTIGFLLWNTFPVRRIIGSNHQLEVGVDIDTIQIWRPDVLGSFPLARKPDVHGREWVCWVSEHKLTPHYVFGR